MTSRLVVVGAGGFGREVVAWAESSPKFISDNGIVDIVYVDDRTPAVPVAHSVFSTITNFVPRGNDLLLCAIGEPALRETITNRLLALGAKFATLVSDGAILGQRVEIGRGSIVCPGVVLTSDIIVGSHVHINIGCMIGHDANIGDFVTMSPSCNLMGNVNVEPLVFFGTAATVTPQNTIGEGSVVGAASLVLKNVEPRVTVFGAPASVVRRHR